MAKKKYYNDEVMGPLKRREFEDSMMIKEDRNAIANLPKDVKYVEYPQYPYYRQPGLNDTITGIDRQLASDRRSKGLKTENDPEMY